MASPAPRDAPVVIVGAGLAGSGAAWALSRRGVPVVVLEQFGERHPHGGSHGSARIVRRAYNDPVYAGLTGEALERWAEVEHDAATVLIRRLGGLDFGAGRDVGRLAASLAAVGARPEVLPADEAAQRWPGMRFDGPVVFHAEAGTLDADGAVTALLSLARGAGADVRHSAPVAAVRDGGVQLADGSFVAARAVVVAAGGWAAGLLGAAVPGLPGLTVTRQSVFHFPRRDPATPAWPSTIHERGPGRAYDAVYHLAGGRDGGSGDDRKIGVHDPGPVVSAPALGTGSTGSTGSTDAFPSRIDPAVRDYLVDYVSRWLPGLVPEPRGETTCLYTSTPTEDFVLDRVGDVIVCSPCSGHGAKFAPLVGEWVASLVTGDGAAVPGRFRLAAHRAAGTARVSL